MAGVTCCVRGTPDIYEHPRWQSPRTQCGLIRRSASCFACLRRARGNMRVRRHDDSIQIKQRAAPYGRSLRERSRRDGRTRSRFRRSSINNCPHSYRRCLYSNDFRILMPCFWKALEPRETLGKGTAPSGRSSRSGSTPYPSFSARSTILEHVQDKQNSKSLLPDRVSAASTSAQTGTLGLNQQRVQEGATCVRIHRVRPRRGTKNRCPERAMVAARGFRSPRQALHLHSRQPRHGLDGAHDAKHPSNVTLRQGHRDIGKQMRMRSVKIAQKNLGSPISRSTASQQRVTGRA